MARTGNPAPAIAALTDAIEWIRRWKIDAASTASAPPSRTAATKSAGPRSATRRDDRHRHAIGDRPEQVGVEAEPGPVTVDRRHEQLAGPELDRALGPLDRVERRRLAAALDVDLHSSAAAHREAHRSRRPRLPPEARAHAVIRSGSATAAVLSETLSAPARSTSRISSTVRTPPPTVSGTNARRAVRSTTSSSVPRRSGGGDVEEHELVGALAGVALGQLGRIALVDEVDEARALDDAAIGDVEAGDDPAAEHQDATPAGARSDSPTSDEVREEAQAIVAAALGVELDAEEVAASDRRDEAAAVLGLARITSSAVSAGAPAYEWTK